MYMYIRVAMCCTRTYRLLCVVHAHTGCYVLYVHAHTGCYVLYMYIHSMQYVILNIF